MLARLTFLLLSTLLCSLSAHATDSTALWGSVDESGKQNIELYFFWSERCPHCQVARPAMQKLAAELDWLTLHSYGLEHHPEHRQRFREMAALFGQQPRSVPAFFFCGRVLFGFDSEETTGQVIRQALSECHARQLAGETPVLAPQKINLKLPLFDTMAADDLSLPLVTLAIAGLDAFNPCAFFVLLFLLSLLVHAKSRKRIFFIGGVFVLFSGLIYFLFMATWLNVFLLVEQVVWITTLAGAIAVVMALVNIKDYFAPGRGPSLSIAEQNKPGLFQRMRRLLHTDRLLPLTVGTVVLAVTVNSYELLCTSGLPMVYTRLLTLEQLPGGSYYLYLVAYNVIYVIPLFIIVTLFALTLGARKLQAHEGRLLKLLSGLMMLGLGAVLVLAPQRLSQLSVAFAIILLALTATALAYLLEKIKKRLQTSD